MEILCKNSAFYLKQEHENHLDGHADEYLEL